MMNLVNCKNLIDVTEMIDMDERFEGTPIVQM
jgi:hypothetical protein